MIRSIFYIEAQGKPREVVEDSLRGLVDKMRGEKHVDVTKVNFEDTIKEEGRFLSAAEIHAKFESLEDYVMAALKYGPSAIEVLEPRELILSSKDFLDVIGEVLVVAKKVYKRHGISFKFPKGKHEGEIGLNESDIEELLDQGAIRAKIVIESEIEDREKVKRESIRAMGSEEIYINKVKSKKLEGKEGAKVLVGIEAFVPEPKTLVDIAIKHTPVLMEIVEPEEVKLTTLDIQDIGLDLAGIFFEIAHKVAFK